MCFSGGSKNGRSPIRAQEVRKSTVFLIQVLWKIVIKCNYTLFWRDNELKLAHLINLICIDKFLTQKVTFT